MPKFIYQASKMRNCFITIVLFCSAFFISGRAQNNSFTYEFLSLPASAKAAALGGNILSSPENDLSLSLHNPALLSSDNHHQLSLGYMNYVADIHFGNALYSRKINDISAWAAGVRYLDYGHIQGNDQFGQSTGKLAAKDIALSGTYSFLMTDYLRGGISANFIYSVLDEYTSLGMTVDLGLYYFNEEKLFWAGLVAKNLGSQFKPYQDTYERLPWDIQLGASKKLEHAPFRISLTAEHLWEWTLPDLKWHEQLLRHFIVGVEFMPSDAFHLALGYNIRRRVDLSIEQRNMLSGLSAGCHFKVKHLQIGLAYAKYHVSGNSLSFNISIPLSKSIF